MENLRRETDLGHLGIAQLPCLPHLTADPSDGIAIGLEASS